ncbi:MAG: PilZ domain-containing protein [Halofilum sp. (in: g-proteobacteria)]|nr:PilZ domain-containing protein [Halofilum sp. (in: g-proteobacteria)]
MQERRDYQRRHLMFHLRVYDADSGQELGTLADVSPDGLMVTGERRLTLGRRFNLFMRLPPALTGSDRIEFSATVAWSGNDASPVFYDSGFRDLELDDDDFRVLKGLMDEFDLRDTED